MGNCPITRALISVSDKTGVVALARTLQEWSVEIISTGGTASMLAEAGIKTIEVAHYTGCPEIMGGRVKTLHPKVCGGLLAARDDPEHVRDMETHQIRPIDLVVVNLHPFETAISKPGARRDEAVEKIDIGGVNMLRSAAKNHRHVAAVCDPIDYSLVAQKMKELDGALDDATRRYLAAKAFRLTAYYDARIGAFLAGDYAEKFPVEVSTVVRKMAQLRYGANPSQQAALYQEPGYSEPAITTARQLSGKQLSFNNLLDANTALELVRELDGPAVVVVKHNNPCGAAVCENLAEAFVRAYDGDPLAAYRGVVALNRTLTVAVAEAMCDKIKFIDVIVAPSIEDEAEEILKTKPKWGSNVRILDLMCGEAVSYSRGGMDIRRLRGGYLLQTEDPKAERRDSFKTVSRASPTEAQLADMELAWTVAKHATTNAIVLVKDSMVVGVGAGVMKRSSAVTIALKTAGDRAKGAVLASDAFFPYNRTILPAIEAGVSAVIHPGGSKNDANLIELVNERGIVLVETGVRHFRH